MKTPRARVVLRVSTDDQDEQQQLDPCLRRIAYGDQSTPWAFDEKTGIYRAHGVSGGDLDAAFRRRVFDDAAAGLFERLVVYELSRWTRGGILVVLSDRNALAKCNVRLVCVRQDWVENDLLLAICAYMDEEKLRVTSDETKKALVHKRGLIAKHGGYTRQADGKWITRIGGRDVVPISDAAIATAMELREQKKWDGRPAFGWRAVATELLRRGHGVRRRGEKDLVPFKHATIRLRCQQTSEKPDLQKPGKGGG